MQRESPLRHAERSQTVASQDKNQEVGNGRRVSRAFLKEVDLPERSGRKRLASGEGAAGRGHGRLDKLADGRSAKIVKIEFKTGSDAER